MEKDIETKTINKEKEIKDTEKKKIDDARVKKEEISVEPDVEKDKKEEKQKEAEINVKKKDKKLEKPKKTEAIVNGYGVPISTKQSIAICRFIKGKKVGDAIRDLEKVILIKKAVSMKGEIPHRKGRGMSSGRYPQKAAKNFIILLKSLLANATEIDEPVISEAIANLASRPLGKFGRVKRKRTHIKIIVKEKNKITKSKKINKKIRGGNKNK